jgi:2-methylcitrate dehydratase
MPSSELNGAILLVCIWSLPACETHCTHTKTDNLGAILAVSDILNRTGEKKITTQTILEALVKAYEIQGVFQIRNSYNKVGLDHVINVKVASTAVVSWLIGLTKDTAKAAISHAFIDGHPLRTYRHAPNAGPRKGWAGGDAAMRAVHIAYQVKKGQPGLPTALTAPRWGFYDVLFKGEQFEFPQKFGTWCAENILFKVNCAEGHALTAVEAAVSVSKELKSRGKTVDDIAKVAVRTQEAAMDIINKQGAMNNPADRDHCMQARCPHSTLSLSR